MFMHANFVTFAAANAFKAKWDEVRTQIGTAVADDDKAEEEV